MNQPEPVPAATAASTSAPATHTSPPPAPAPSTAGSASSRQWNTAHLPSRLAADAAGAFSAGILVAPVISVIDRAIIENSSGRNSLGASLLGGLRQLALRPHHFLASRALRLIFTLYSGTYLAANTIDTATSTIQARPADSVSAGPAKFVGTTSVNISLCIYKDSQFTKMFGNPALAGASRRVPLTSLALFGFRDCITVFASFNVPPLLAPVLPMHLLGPTLEKSISSAHAAQFLAPLAVQLVSTPVHLLGLDFYNRPKATPTERVVKVSREWFVSCVARMGRVLPAFGFGGVVNSSVRQNMMKKLDQN